MFSVYVEKEGLRINAVFPWKVSIVGFMANPPVLKSDVEAVKETIEVIANDPFFDVIELNILSDNAWNAAKNFLKASKLEVASGLQPLVLAQGYNPSALGEDDRRRAVEAIKKAIDTSIARGIKRVAFCSGPDPGPSNREAAKDALVKSLKEITGYAAKLGVYVILETFDREWDKKQLIGKIEEAVEIAETIRGEYSNFGLLWDLSHAPMLDETPQDLRKAANYLAHIHIGCAKKMPDGSLKDWHPGFYRPGAINGVDEVKELIAVLREIGYKGAIGFEVKPEEGQVWQEVVHAAKGVLYTAYAKYLVEQL